MRKPTALIGGILAGLLLLSSCTELKDSIEIPQDPGITGGTTINSFTGITSTTPPPVTETEVEYWHENYDVIPLSNAAGTLPKVDVRVGDDFLGLRVEKIMYYRSFTGSRENPTLSHSGAEVFFSGDLTLTGTLECENFGEWDSPMLSPNEDSLQQLPMFEPEYPHYLIAITGADELYQQMLSKCTIPREEIEPRMQAGEDVPYELIVWENCTLTLRDFQLYKVPYTCGYHHAALVDWSSETEPRVSESQLEPSNAQAEGVDQAF